MLSADCCVTPLAYHPAAMTAAGSTEMDAIEVSSSTRKQLHSLVTTIYRHHWINTLKVDKRAMISREDLNAEVDLQPVLQAIVSHAVPEHVHQRVLANALDETASYQEAANLDPTKHAETQKLLEPFQKRMRKEQKAARQLE